MIKKIAIVSLVIFALANQGNAQSQLMNLNWNVGIPQGDTKDFLNDEDVSFGGFSMDYRKFVKENLSVGGYWAWDFFNGTESDGVFIDGNTTLTGEQRYYLNSFPFMVNTHFYTGVPNGVRAYLGVGLGAVRTLERTEIGTFILQNNNWQFGFYPEVGMLFPINYSTNITLGAKYNMALESSDAFAHQAITINIGVAIVNF